MTDAEDASALGRALAARRRRATYRCEVCGEPFEAWEREKQIPRTCSNRCRQKLHRDEKQAIQRGGQ